MIANSPIPVSVPPLYLCTDNAAMIAAAGYYTWASSVRSAMNLDVIANLSLV
jgi:N6-L-threonylcarbamoyladenine synthase